MNLIGGRESRTIQSFRHRIRHAIVPQRTSPSEKIARIREIARKLSPSALAGCFDEFYYSTIHNSVYHSDYVLHDHDFRIRNGGPNSISRKAELDLKPL
jgi:hypothetical protein